MPIVGRDTELARLSRTVAEVATGQGGENLAAYRERDTSPAAQAIGYFGAGLMTLFQRQPHQAIALTETALAHARECETETPFFAHYIRTTSPWCAAVSTW
jgi:hypothetical protein